MKRKHRWEDSELPELVREALAALQPVPEVDPARWEENRRAFLAEVHTHTADPSAVSEGAVRLPAWRRALQSLFALDRQQSHPTALALRLALILVLLLGGTTGTVLAARDSLPGSLLYPIKVQLESWRIQRARVPEEVTRQALAQSQTRVEEATRLATRSRDVPEDVAERYRAQIELALHTTGDLDEPGRQQARSEISKTLQQQLETMAQVAARVRGEDDGDDDHEAVNAMIQTMEWTQAELGSVHRNQDAGEREQPGPSREAVGKPEEPKGGEGTDLGDDDGDGGVQKPPSSDEPADRPGAQPPDQGDRDNGAGPDEPSDHGPSEREPDGEGDGPPGGVGDGPPDGVGNSPPDGVGDGRQDDGRGDDPPGNEAPPGDPNNDSDRANNPPDDVRNRRDR